LTPLDDVDGEAGTTIAPPSSHRICYPSDLSQPPGVLDRGYASRVALSWRR